MLTHAHEENLVHFQSSRWLSALPPAAIFTVALLALMVKLVVVDMEAPEEVTAPNIESPVYKEKDLLTQIKNELPEKEPVEHPPEIPESMPRDLNNEGVTIPKMKAPVQIREKLGIFMDGMPIAQFQVAAKYPRRALTSGIEGYVDVRFDITRVGTTENINVVAASPEGYFERSALDAVKRWRYQPRVVDGEARVFRGMTQRIRFVMEAKSS